MKISVVIENTSACNLPVEHPNQYKIKNMTEDRKMYVEMPIAVHSYDVDLMHIVNNTVHVRWLEDLRIAILDKYLPLPELLAAGTSPILAETKIQYKHPVTLDSRPVGRCWIWMKGRSRWVAEHIIEENGTIYATAQQTGYLYDINRHRPVPFPEWVLEKYMEQ